MANGYYEDGTVSITNNTKALVGVGTAWASTIKSGDKFVKNGLSNRIDTVNSNTSISLLDNWTGGTLAGVAYGIEYLPDTTRALAALNQVYSLIGGNNLQAEAALSGSADTISYYTGPGAKALASFTAWARSLLGLTMAANKIAYGIGASAMALTDLLAGPRAMLGLTAAAGKMVRFDSSSSAAMADIVGTVAQSGGTPTGALFEYGSNANGAYLRFADGTQIAWRTVSHDTTITTPQVWSFPASFSGTPWGNGSVRGATSAHLTDWANGHGSAYAFDATQWNTRTNVTGTNTVTIYLTAIGRWF